MKLLFYTLSAVVILSACNSGLGNHQRTARSVPTTPFKAPPPITAFPKAEATSASAATPASNNNSVVTNPEPVNAATTITPTTTTPANSNLNPAHGQPGHRCDIAVGQPLNSAPAKSAAATPVASKTTTTNTTPVANIQADATSGVKLNPKHGQPGHRCDISVGQPLNSAPAQSTPAVTPAPEATAPVPEATTPSVVVGTPSPVVGKTPSTSNPFSNNNFFPAKPAATSGVKLNPKHGQPGHRCDISVGQPLN